MGIKRINDFSVYPRRAIVLPDASGGQREEELPAGELGLDGSYKHALGYGPIFPLNGSLNTRYFIRQSSGRGLFTLAATGLKYMRAAALKAGLDWIKEVDKKTPDTVFLERYGYSGAYFYHNYSDQLGFFKKNNELVVGAYPVGSVVRNFNNSNYLQKKKIQGIYDPLPGRSIFGTGLAMILPKFSTRMMAWLKVNANTYGFAWSADVPTSDPLFSRIIHYHFGTEQPPYWALSGITIRH